MAWPRPTLSTLLRRTKEDLKSRVSGDPFLKRSFEAALANVVAALTHGLYGHQEWIARQAVPGPDADDETILQWAAIFLATPQVLATRATGSATFTGTDTTVLPEGTELAIGDELYTVDADGTVTGGEVTVTVTAVDAGADGNAEETARISLTTAISGIDSDGAVAAGGLTGGTDDEDIDSIRDRLQSRLANPPRAGGPGDFRAWVLETPGLSIKEAWEYPLRSGVGTVGVAFTIDDADPIPSAGERTTVQEYVESVMPTFMRELVVMELTGVNFTATVNISPNTTATETAVKAAFEDMLDRLAEPEEPLLLSSIYEALAGVTSLDDFALVSPVANVDPGASAILVYDAASITVGSL